MNTKQIELPPAYFSNVVNRLELEIDWHNWRQSPYWELFVAGNNYGIDKVKSFAQSQENMGMNSERLFGK